MNRSRNGSHEFCGSISSVVQYAATRISTHERAEPRCGVPALCDIWINLNRNRREIISSSAIVGSPGFNTGAVRTLLMLFVVEMNHAMNDFATTHPGDPI